LLKKLIYQYWQTLKPRQTLAQIRGGHPQDLLQDVDPDLSLRENRKKIIAVHIAYPSNKADKLFLRTAKKANLSI